MRQGRENCENNNVVGLTGPLPTKWSPYPQTHRRQTIHTDRTKLQTNPGYEVPRVVQLSFANVVIRLQREPLVPPREG